MTRNIVVEDFYISVGIISWTSEITYEIRQIFNTYFRSLLLLLASCQFKSLQYLPSV